MSEPLPSAPADAGQTLPTHHGAPVQPTDETRVPPGAVTMVPPPTELRHVAGYVVEKELGRGGMGVVYLARDGKLGRTVALKMILSGAHASSDDMLRFLSEAQAVAGLQHPHIVQLHEIGQHDDLPYFTLEYVPGGSLAARLRGEPQPPRDAARLIELLARAVDHAHRSGIVHRDLKPANVLLAEGADTPLGHCTPKVTDFGLAKRTQGGSGMTQSGAVVGTPSYMAPEQAAGKSREVGPLVDVYALGAMLYELLTGRPPFRATTAAETLVQVIVDEPVAVRQFQSRTPRDLETIAHKCLHKDAARRYASAAELADDLQRFHKGEPIQARPVGRIERGWRWCRRNPVVASLLALVAVLLVGAGTLITWQWQAAVAALKLADEEKRARALAQVNALRDAAPGAVPTLLQELASQRDTILPRLRELWQEGGDRGRRMRVGLALLPVEPDAVRDELAKWMLEVRDPAEAVVIRDALVPHAERLRAGLWERAGDEKEEDDARFRCLAALAAFAPDDARWTKRADVAVAEMLKANPLHLGVWVQALKPVGPTLSGPLSKVFREEKSAERREFAAIVLSDYVAAQPETLAALLLDADPKQYAVLFPVLQRSRDQAVARMRRELQLSPHDWNDPPLDPRWSEVPAELRREIEAAGGLVEERWALCQSLPLERVSAVTEGLRTAGYRPVRVRPYLASRERERPEGRTPVAHAPGSPSVVVVWTRDGRDWKLETGLTAAAVQERDAFWQKAGFIPVDAAGDGSRFTVLWVKAQAGEQGLLYVDVAEKDHTDSQAGYQKEGFLPVALQSLKDAAGGFRFCGVWHKRPGPLLQGNWLRDSEQDDHAGKVLAGEQLLVDVDVRALPAFRSFRADWEPALTTAAKTLADKPNDLAALYRCGQARFWLNRDAEALADLDRFIARGNPLQAYQLRAILHARRGQAEAAQRDLAQFLDRSKDAGEKAYAAAVVAFHLGQDTAAVAALEETLKTGPRADVLLGVARGYARGAELLAAVEAARAAGLIGAAATPGLPVYLPSSLQPGALRQQALALLSEALDGNTPAANTLRQPDFEGLHDRKEFRALVARSALDRRYAAVWHIDPGREAQAVTGLAAEGHLVRCRELAAKGYRPVALSLTHLAEGQPLAASVWHRPVATREDREQLARRQATGAATLLKLQAAQDAWPLFQQRPDPEARSQLIWRSGLLGVPAEQIVERLEQEDDVTARRALILTLGEYTDTQLPLSLRQRILPRLLTWYRDDPDPGIHAAVDWLLRHSMEGPEKRLLDWKQAAVLKQLDVELRKRDTSGASPVAPRPEKGGPGGEGLGARRWYVNGQGQTMIAIPGPVEFRMGAPLSDPERHSNQPPHLRRIPRSFAIASKSVTVAEFQRFLKERPDVPHNYTTRYSPAPEGPMISVTWFEAAQFCNWLSEKEGLPETEWCYPKHEDIKDGMKLDTDYLKRKGYRLPTEAEWEYAARAETASSRSYGSSLELLRRYAWYAHNAQDQAWPVGQKRPNDLGLFDNQGNVFNWVADGFFRYPQMRGMRGAVDDERLYGANNLDITDSKSSLVLRGGSFFDRPTLARDESLLQSAREPRQRSWLAARQDFTIGTFTILPFTLLSLSIIEGALRYFQPPKGRREKFLDFSYRLYRL